MLLTVGAMTPNAIAGHFGSSRQAVSKHIQILAECGAVETMTRGTREWLITIPADGRLPLGGALPMLIEWQSPRAPVGAGLPEAGCALAMLGLRHPEPNDERQGWR